MSRPIWLLDVDGVVAPVDEPHGPHQHQHERGPAYLGRAWGLWVCWDKALMQRIGDLHRNGLVEVVWLTSWSTNAASDFAPLVGLPAFDVAPDARLARSTWGKLDMAEAYLRDHPGRPFIWTDDHLAPARRAVIRKRCPQPSLLIQPKTNVGLTDKDMDRIEKFAKEAA